MADVERRQFTVAEFARMGEIGIFSQQERVELLEVRFLISRWRRWLSVSSFMDTWNALKCWRQKYNKPMVTLSLA